MQGSLPPPADDAIRVLVVDDHVLYRRGLEVVLNQEDDIRVVAEAGNGPDAVAAAADVTPDIVLMDVRMPGGGGIPACRQIRDLSPTTRVIMITTSDDERDLVESIRAGATGYLLKDVPPEEVVAGIRAVHAGQSLLSPSLASTLLDEFASILRSTSEQRTVPAPHLTDRELEVLRLVAQGLGNREIAKRLFISENTVKNHVRNILEKLQMHSRMEAALYAVRERLLDGA
ncbi:response regulator [Gephyromycinifex aptenodytis]|uniref:response regulator n=1 Tax=Gephyromycinifex aptenodytis TaxID=2716227 RepID=UPI0014471627|nr:response regulator transcription factor [Gephyromycinifex aptenodytis]